MSLLKVLIADDEKEARELILHYLSDWKKKIETKESADGNTTLQLLQQYRPDVLFLDIKMPGITGLEVLQQREPDLLPAVVFTTAFDHYALPAFDFEAVDYLLKPFEKERFDRSMKKALDYVEFTKNKRTAEYLSQIMVKTGSRTDIVALQEIEYFQAEGAYVQLVTATKTFLLTETIYELEAALDPSMFARVHRSVIVNIQLVKTIQSLQNGDHLLILKGGKEIRASRTYRDSMKKLKSG